MVLLENHNHALPLSGGVSSVAVVGPLANDPSDQLGPDQPIGYSVADGKVVSVLDGIKAAVPNAKVTYAQGCDPTCASTGDFGAAVSAAQSSDVTVVVLGEPASDSSCPNFSATVIRPINASTLALIAAAPENVPARIVRAACDGVDGPDAITANTTAKAARPAARPKLRRGLPMTLRATRSAISPPPRTRSDTEPYPGARERKPAWLAREPQGPATACSAWGGVRIGGRGPQTEAAPAERSIRSRYGPKYLAEIFVGGDHVARSVIRELKPCPPL